MLHKVKHKNGTVKTVLGLHWQQNSKTVRQQGMLVRTLSFVVEVMIT